MSSVLHSSPDYSTLENRSTISAPPVKGEVATTVDVEVEWYGSGISDTVFLMLVASVRVCSELCLLRSSVHQLFSVARTPMTELDWRKPAWNQGHGVSDGGSVSGSTGLNTGSIHIERTTDEDSHNIMENSAEPLSL